MPYLMEICFDNDRRLRRKHYLFEYRGIRFKLFQDRPRKWADHLLTILPEYDMVAREQAFAVASEFLSALSWENRARIAVWECGGGSWHKEWPLSKAMPRTYTFPKIPFGGNIVGYDIAVIPKVETVEQRIALTLFRETGASNNDYLSFLFYWQVMETGGSNAEGFVNKTYRRQPRQLGLASRDISRSPLRGRPLGEYLRDECRDAIAHIRRKPGKRKLELDRTEERYRVSTSTRVAKAFAEY